MIRLPVFSSLARTFPAIVSTSPVFGSIKTTNARSNNPVLGKDFAFNNSSTMIFSTAICKFISIVKTRSFPGLPSVIISDFNKFPFLSIIFFTFASALEAHPHIAFQDSFFLLGHSGCSLLISNSQVVLWVDPPRKS